MKLAKDRFVEQIADLCRAGETGTIFAVTGKNHQAKIILREGQIIAAFLRPLSGVDAISALAKERELSFAFNSGLLMEVNSQILPDTASLLDFMKNSVAPTMPGFVASASPAGEIDLNTVRHALVEEATEFLGPIAGPICDEYLANQAATMTSHDILQVIARLQRDINDQDKADTFERAVRSRLGLP